MQMKIVIAIDSLKDSITSFEAGKAAEEGIRRVYGKDSADIIVKPLADGGEGTVRALVSGMEGEIRIERVEGPLGTEVSCEYGYLRESQTAIIEMAGAAGIGMVHGKDRNPMNTSTYGVGQLIRKAMDAGIRKFIIGIGGSATNDCGIGMLQALGYEFLDSEGKIAGRGGKALNDIVSVNLDKVPDALSECNFKVACDVTNPLCGPNGCSVIYGPQKGADTEMTKKLDDFCRKFAKVTKEVMGNDHINTPGAGAAGGLGFAFLSYLNGVLEPGTDIVLNEIQIEKALADADYLITGEGRLDHQTAMGKGPVGIAKMAKKYGVKVIGLAGSYTDGAQECNVQGIDAYFAIVPGAMDLKDAMDAGAAKKNMANTAEQVFRLIRAADCRF